VHTKKKATAKISWNKIKSQSSNTVKVGKTTLQLPSTVSEGERRAHRKKDG
jgi:hypothetical protein